MWSSIKGIINKSTVFHQKETILHYTITKATLTSTLTFNQKESDRVWEEAHLLILHVCMWALSNEVILTEKQALTWVLRKNK